MENETEIMQTPEELQIELSNDSEFKSNYDRLKKFLSTGNYKHLSTVVNKSKIGRNDVCICGSGKKYKKCCGR